MHCFLHWLLVLLTSPHVLWQIGVLSVVNTMVNSLIWSRNRLHTSLSQLWEIPLSELRSSFPGLPCFMFFSFAFTRSIIHRSADFHVVYILIANRRTKNGEAWKLGYNKPSSNNLLGAIGDILYKYHSWTYFHTLTLYLMTLWSVLFYSWIEMDRWFLDLHAWLEIRHRAKNLPNLV